MLLLIDIIGAYDERSDKHLLMKHIINIDYIVYMDHVPSTYFHSTITMIDGKTFKVELKTMEKILEISQALKGFIAT